jgi:group I intron endonuclease
VGCVYLATNLTNGKQYVGKTILTLSKRKEGHWKDAKSGRGYLFQRALRKYGLEGFSWELLCSTEVLEELNVKERKYVKQYNTKSPNGYNLTDGGEGMLGACESVRLKMSLAHKGKPKSEEHKRKMSIANKGKKMPVGFKEKMLKIHLGRKCSEETKKKMSESNWLRGKNHTQESKDKMSLAHKGKKLSDETRAKMSKAKMGNPGNKGKKLSADHRKNIGLGLLGNKRSEETKLKMSESMKKTLREKRERLELEKNDHDRRKE